MNGKIKVHELVFLKTLEQYLQDKEKSGMDFFKKKDIFERKLDKFDSQYVRIRFNEGVQDYDCLEVIKLLKSAEERQQQREPAVSQKVQLWLCLSLLPGNETSKEKIKAEFCRIIGYKEEKGVVIDEKGKDRVIKIGIFVSNLTSVVEILEKLSQEWDDKLVYDDEYGNRFLVGVTKGQKVQKTAQQQARPVKSEDRREKFLIPQQLFDKIKPKTIKSLLKQGCSVQPAMDKQYTSLVLNGMGLRKDHQLRKKIFTLLISVTQDKQPFKQHDQEHDPIMLHLWIPNGKAGYVVGRKGEVIEEIKTSFDVRAFMVKNIDASSPVSKLTLSSGSIQDLMQARKKVQKLLDTADNASNMDKDVQDRMFEQISIPGAIYQEKQALFERIIEDYQSFIADNSDIGSPTKRFTISAETMLEVRKIRKKFLDVKRTPDYQEKKVLSIETPIWIMMIGKRGKTIKDLQKRLNVSLTFEGKNNERHLEHRNLLIKGRSQEDVTKADLYIRKYMLGLQKAQVKNARKERIQESFVAWVMKR